MGRDNPLRQIPRLYGKVQAPRPARWLSHSEAFVDLIGACRDGSDLGLRDEAIVRLGLAGMRAAEIIHLRIGDLRLGEAAPVIEWIGKKRRARWINGGLEGRWMAEGAEVAADGAEAVRRDFLAGLGRLARHVGGDGGASHPGGDAVVACVEHGAGVDTSPTMRLHGAAGDDVGPPASRPTAVSPPRAGPMGGVHHRPLCLP